ncbi:MAG TPA: NIPSNAP family protein [Burkholderiaceae bacterium]
MSIAPPSLTDASPPGSRLVEIRAYKLVPGTRAEFHLAMSRALELVRDYGMDVVAHGHSSEEDGYFLIRAFDDRAHLKAQQDGFYGSRIWREGPRESIVSRIAVSLDTLLWLSPAAIDELRLAMS